MRQVDTEPDQHPGSGPATPARAGAPTDPPHDSSSGPGEPDEPTGGASERPSRSARSRFPIIAFVSIGAVLFLVVWLTRTYAEINDGYIQPKPLPWPDWLEGWVRWDAGWYRNIAENGYSYDPGKQSTVAFFPSYPFAMRALEPLFRDYAIAGIFITFCSGLGTAVLFYKWCADRLSPATARVALLLLLLYPYSWYLYGAVYADAFFLVSVLGAFVLVERDRPVLAGLVAIVAVVGRPVGLAVFLGLVLRIIERRRAVRLGLLERWDVVDAELRDAPPDDFGRVGLQVRLRRLQWRDLAIVVSLSGFVAYVVYLWHRWSDPLLFVTVQQYPPWNQEPGPHTWLKIELLNSVRFKHDWVYNWGIIAQGLLCLLCVLMVWFVARRLGWAYACYVLGVVAIPAIGSKDFQGMGRYLLAAFPVFAVAGDLLVTRPRTQGVILGVCSVTLLFLVMLFARGYYVA